MSVFNRIDDLDWWRATHSTVWGLVATVGFYVAWLAVVGGGHDTLLMCCEVVIAASVCWAQIRWHTELDTELESDVQEDA